MSFMTGGGSEASSYIIENWGEIFNKNIIDSDKISYSRYGRYKTDKPFLEKTYDIIVEAGEKRFYIKCKRFRKTEDSPVELTYTFYDPVEMLKKRYYINEYDLPKNSYMYERYLKEVEWYKKKRSKAPLAIFISDYQKHYEDSRSEIENPILKDLPITGLLPATEVWQGIYDYLLKMKEPVIVDSRTNDEHIESAGFDKKTSFRNVK